MLRLIPNTLRCQETETAPLTFEGDWPQCDGFSVVGGVEGSLLARAAALATAGVVVVVSADDHPTLQEDVGMSPQELEGPEMELSVVLPAIGVYVDRAVLRTAKTKEQKKRERSHKKEREGEREREREREMRKH